MGFRGIEQQVGTLLGSAIITPWVTAAEMERSGQILDTLGRQWLTN